MNENDAVCNSEMGQCLLCAQASGNFYFYPTFFFSEAIYTDKTWTENANCADYTACNEVGNVNAACSTPSSKGSKLSLTLSLANLI